MAAAAERGVFPALHQRCVARLSGLPPPGRALPVVFLWGNLGEKPSLQVSWGNGSGKAQSLCSRCISWQPLRLRREGGFCPANKLYFLFSGSWEFTFFKTNCRCFVLVCSCVWLSSSMLCSDKYHEDLGILFGMNGTLR